MSDFYEESIAVVERPIERTDSKSDRFWRVEYPEFDAQRRIVVGGMWSHQREWWNLKNFIKALVGGFGAGKTIALGKRLIALSLENAPAPVASVSPTFPIARHTMIPTIIGLLEGKRQLLGRAFWWKFNKSIHEFTIKYHGREGKIIVYSGEDPLSLRGPNLAAVGIDEPFLQDISVFHQMIARIRHPDARVKELLLTGTPEELNWGYDLCIGDMEEQHDVGVVFASTRLNLALTPDYVTRLEGAFTEKAALAYIEGKFVSLSTGTVYFGFDPDENVMRLTMPIGAELGAGMDFNVNPMAAAVFWRSGSHMHFFKEIELPNADTEYMCSVLRELYWEQGLRDIYPDATGTRRTTNSPSGKSDFHYIRDAGFELNARSSNPLRRDRYNAVNGKFKPSKGRLTLTIDPSCKKLIKYLSLLAHETLNKQKEMTHLTDAFSYPISYLFPVDRQGLRQVRYTGV